MRSPSAEFDAAIRAGAQRHVSRVWSLDAERQPIAVFEDILEGSVMADRTRAARRTGSLTLENVDGRYRLEPGSLFVFDRIRIERGLRFDDGHAEYVTIFTGLTASPALRGRTVELEATDMSALVAEAEFEEPVTFPRGMDMGDYLRALLVLAGWPDEDAWYDFEDLGFELRTDVSHDPPERIWEAALDAARDEGLRLFCDAEGTLKLRSVPVLADAMAVWSFAPGPEATGRVMAKALDLSRLRNRAVARGATASGQIVQEEARDLNPDSPVYNPPPGHPDYPGSAGDRPIRLESAGIVDSDQAKEVARVLLQDNGLAQETIELQAIAHPGLDEEDLIEVRSDETPADATYAVDRVTLSLTGLTQTIEGRRSRRLTP